MRKNSRGQCEKAAKFQHLLHLGAYAPYWNVGWSLGYLIPTLLPANVPGKQWMIDQVLEFLLPPTWGTWMELPAPGSSLPQLVPAVI